MSQAIISRTIATLIDQRCQLQNGQISRQLEMLTTWNVIRIGLQISFTASASATGTPLLVMGIRSGIAAAEGWMGNGTRHFVGARLGTSGTWTYHAGPPAYFDSGSPGIVKKVGSVITAAGFATGFASCASAAPTTARNALIVQITKGSPNYSLDFVFTGQATPAQTDVGDAAFLNLMEMGSMSNANSVVTNYTNAGAGTVAVNEGVDGVLDTVCIHWDKTTPSFEISDAKVRKVS